MHSSELGGHLDVVPSPQSQVTVSMARKPGSVNTRVKSKGTPTANSASGRSIVIEPNSGGGGRGVGVLVGGSGVLVGGGGVFVGVGGSGVFVGVGAVGVDVEVGIIEIWASLMVDSDANTAAKIAPTRIVAKNSRRPMSISLISICQLG